MQPLPAPGAVSLEPKACGVCVECLWIKAVALHCEVSILTGGASDKQSLHGAFALLSAADLNPSRQPSSDGPGWK